MKKVKALIFSGYGLNSEEETAYGFQLAGAETKIVHINDVIENKRMLDSYSIISFPGGFSYGDDTGAGNAYAGTIKNHLWESVKAFVEKDNLVIGICNGCQIVTNLGLVPAFHNDYGNREVALSSNTSARFTTRWTDMKVVSNTPWLHGINNISLPVAHGEGNFTCNNITINQLRTNKQIALQYVSGEMCNYLDLPANPNGSAADIAGITDESGRILGLMPHPERGMFFVQRPDWNYLKQQYLKEKKKLPTEGPGLQLFKNAISYFS